MILFYPYFNHNFQIQYHYKDKPIGGICMRYENCMDGYLSHGSAHGMSYFGYGSHLFVSTIIIIIIALLIFAFLHHKKKNSTSSSEAAEILKMRFVNGEITEEEYLRMKKIIQ